MVILLQLIEFDELYIENNELQYSAAVLTSVQAVKVKQNKTTYDEIHRLLVAHDSAALLCA